MAGDISLQLMSAIATFIDRKINAEHLRAAIQTLNQYLLREVRRRTQNTQQQQLDQLQGLILNEHEILSILSEETRNTEDAVASEGDLLAARRVERQMDSLLEEEACSFSQLDRLVELFDLTWIEKQCLVLCLAAEIDPSYAKVYAYLQDDVTQKHPSVGLALRLFCADDDERIEARAIFAGDAPLVKYRLLCLSETSERVSALPHLTLKLDDRIA